jgi:serine protease Do
VLKIDSKGRDLKPLPWGDSSKMRIGDWVIAIGNPLGLRGSVSKGIVSAKGRKIGKAGIEHLIQTDAMINPGNSGGALVNLRGELIGVNMAIATTSGFFQGIGFAVPSNDAKYITDQVIETGKIERGYIGISMRNLDDDGCAPRWA